MRANGVSFVSSLFAAAALASPYDLIQARQDASYCYSNYYSSCSNTVQSRSATAWCASLGYGTQVITVTSAGTGTATVLKTLISTKTSYTSTTTRVGPTSTSTFPVTKTTTLTRYTPTCVKSCTPGIHRLTCPSVSTLRITSTTSTVTINAAGTIESCGTYTPTYSSYASGTTGSTPTSAATSAHSTGSSQTSTTTVTTPISTPTSSAVATCTDGAPAVIDNSPPRVLYNGFDSCPSGNRSTVTFQGATSNRTTFLVSCGQDFIPNGRQYPYNPGPYIPNVASIQDCMAQCLQLQGNNCGGITYLTGVDQAPIDGPRCYFRGRDPYDNPYDQLFTSDIYPPDFGLQYDNNYNHAWYWTSAQRQNFPQAPPATDSCTPATTTDSYPPAYSINPSSLPTCTQGNCGNYDACPSDDRTSLTFRGQDGQSFYNFDISCGQDLLESPRRSNFYVTAESLSTCAASCLYDWGDACGGVTFITDGYTPDNKVYIYQCWYRESGLRPVLSNNTIPGTSGLTPSAAGIQLVSALLTSRAVRARDVENVLPRRVEKEMIAARAEPEEQHLAPYEEAVQKRQAVAKPACLKAPSPTATRSACNCVIPSSTTTRTTTTTWRSTVSSTRTVFTTLKAVSTATSTPIQTITRTVSTSTSILTRTTTSTIRTVASTTTTGTWTLASTPAAFYVVDSHNGVAMWPADADEIFYNVQYDDSPDSTDPPPTSFGLQDSQLIINDFVDMDVVVVGQTYNGTGAQVMAFDRRNAAVPNYLNCTITARADGMCPLKCADPRSGGVTSVQDGQGLWYLLPSGATSAGTVPFDTFVLQSS